MMSFEEYASLIGKVVANLQALEFLLRAFLYAKGDPPHSAFPPGKAVDDLKVGDWAPENAMTCYDSLGDLIDRYNKIAPAARRVDPTIVELRDALAHGRVSAPAPGVRLCVGLNQFRDPTRDAEKGVKQSVVPDTTWRANWAGLETERQAETEVLRKTTPARRTMPSTDGHANQWRGRVWLPSRNSMSTCRYRLSSPFCINDFRLELQAEAWKIE